MLILLLILLPLYLWPLRSGLGGPPDATAVPGPRPDPRSAAALARIPFEVWEALMGRPRALAPGAIATHPRNLTMITRLDGLAAGLDASGEPNSPAGLMVAEIGVTSEPVGDTGPAALPEQFLAIPPGDESGTGGPWNGFGPESYTGSGPWPDGGIGGGPRLPETVFAPDDPGAPAPTPEPATLLLVGSNLALLGAAAWRRRRRQERPTGW